MSGYSEVYRDGVPSLEQMGPETGINLNAFHERVSRILAESVGVPATALELVDHKRRERNRRKAQRRKMRGKK